MGRDRVESSVRRTQPLFWRSCFHQPCTLSSKRLAHTYSHASSASPASSSGIPGITGSTNPTSPTATSSHPPASPPQRAQPVFLMMLSMLELRRDLYKTSTLLDRKTPVNPSGMNRKSDPPPVNSPESKNLPVNR